MKLSAWIARTKATPENTMPLIALAWISALWGAVAVICARFGLCLGAVLLVVAWSVFAVIMVRLFKANRFSEHPRRLCPSCNMRSAQGYSIGEDGLWQCPQCMMIHGKTSKAAA